MLLYIYKYIIFILYIKIYKIDLINYNIMSLNKSLSNLLNIKVRNIVEEICENTHLDLDDLSKFVNSKYDFINLNIKSKKSKDLIKDRLIYYLDNDPKFLNFNKTLLDIVLNLKKYAKKNKLNDSHITEDYVNDILILYLNHNNN